MFIVLSGVLFGYFIIGALVYFIMAFVLNKYEMATPGIDAIKLLVPLNVG